MATSQYRLTGSPRLGSVCRTDKPFWQILPILEHIFHRADFFDTRANHFSKLIFNIPTNDNNHFIKTRFQGIMNGIIHNDFSMLTNLLKLLYPSTIARANTGCHNDQCNILHVLNLFIHVIYKYFTIATLKSYPS